MICRWCLKVFALGQTVPMVIKFYTGRRSRSITIDICAGCKEKALKQPNYTVPR